MNATFSCLTVVAAETWDRARSLFEIQPSIRGCSLQGEPQLIASRDTSLQICKVSLARMTMACNINSKRSLRPVRSLGPQDFTKVLLSDHEKKTYERATTPLEGATTMAIPVSGATHVSFFQPESFTEATE